MANQVNGQVGNIEYFIDQSVIDRLKNEHNIDAIKELEDALKKAKQHEDKSTEG